MGVVTDVLGGPCVLTNTLTLETTPLTAIVKVGVEVYEARIFVGLSTTVVIDRASATPLIGDELLDVETGINYTLSGIKAETASKIEFILSPI